MFFLAGYINTVEMWHAFSVAWKFVLDQHPSIQYLKMSEAEALRGQFRGWSREERDKKILKFAYIINLSKPHFIYCSVSRSDYREIMMPVAPHNLMNPYFMTFWGIIDTVARYCQNDGPFLPVEFIFDEQGSLGEDAVLFYNETKKTMKLTLRSVLGDPPTFRDEKTELPLQAADMLAWHVRRNHEKSGDEGRPAYNLITERGAGRHVERRYLSLMAKQIERVPGVEFVQSKSDWKNARKAIFEANQSSTFQNRGKLWMRYQIYKYYFTVLRRRFFTK